MRIEGNLCEERDDAISNSFSILSMFVKTNCYDNANSSDFPLKNNWSDLAVKIIFTFLTVYRYYPNTFHK